MARLSISTYQRVELIYDSLTDCGHSTGKQVSKVETEYSLGSHDQEARKRWRIDPPSFEAAHVAVGARYGGSEEPLRVEGVGDVIPSAHVELELSGGTPCDLESMQRGVTLQLECGLVDALQEVTEDATCHYRMRVSSPRLCNHPALIRKPDPVRRVVCDAIDANTRFSDAANHYDPMDEFVGAVGEPSLPLGWWKSSVYG